MLLTSLWRTKDDWVRLLRWNAVVGVAVGLVAVMGNLFPGSLPVSSGGRLAGTFGNPSFLATYFVVQLFFCLMLAFWSNGKGERWLWSGTALFSVLMIVLSGTRGAYLGTVAGVGVFVVLALLFADVRYRKALWAVLGSGAAGVAALIVFRTAVERTFPLIASRLYAIFTIPPQRLLVWKLGWQAFLNRPIVGWGQENFLYAFDKFFNPEIFRYELALFDRPHNKVIELLFAQGAVGLLLYLAIFALIGWFILKHLWRRPEGRQALMLIILAALWVAYFVQDLVLFEMPTSALLMVFGFAFSSWFLFGEPTQPPRGREPAKAPARRLPGSVVTVLSVVGVGILGVSFAFGVVIPEAASRTMIDAIRILSQPSLTASSFQQGIDAADRARGYDTFLNKEIDVNVARQIRAMSPAPEFRDVFFKYCDTLSVRLVADLKRYRDDYDLVVEAAGLSARLETEYYGQDRGLARGLLEQAIPLAPRRVDAYQQLFSLAVAFGNQAVASENLPKLEETVGSVTLPYLYRAIYEARWGSPDTMFRELAKAKDLGFDIVLSPQERDWLLGSLVRGSREAVALSFVEQLAGDPRLSRGEQLQYLLGSVDLLERLGKSAEAQAKLKTIINQARPEDEQTILQYLKSRGITVGP
jgi:O-antigen ligase